MGLFGEVVEEIRSGSLTIGGSEAGDNTRSISLTAGQATDTSVEAVAGFLEQARIAYATLTSSDSVEVRLRFYAWVDQMAGQLRFSVSSVDPLPFGVPIHFVSAVSDIAQEFLASPYLEGIPWSVLDVVDEDDSIETDLGDGERKPLNVYVVALFDTQSS